MAIVHVATSPQQAACDAVVDLIDVGGTGTVSIYADVIPTDANTAVGAQVLLGVLTFSAAAFGDANTSGVATANAITGDSDANATDTATWARIKDGSGNTIFDCDVTLEAGGGSIEMDEVNIIVNGTIDITNFTVTFGDGVA